MPEPFRLGLVLAGAISAGAYSAGVVDFLMEALDEYELARTTGKTSDGETWDGPRHAVQVPVLTGASAGGMTAAIAAVQMFSHFNPFTGGPVKPALNRLYASWVDEIDATDLLDLSDVQGAGKLRSVLCSAKLEKIVRNTLEQVSYDVKRAWVGNGDALAVISTVSNLGGVPYQFPLRGAEATDAYGMLNHGDSLSFHLGLPRPAHRAGFEAIDLGKPDHAALGRFGAAALATGAFPIGLAARPLTRDFTDYEDDQRIGYDALEDGRLVFRPVPPMAPTPHEMRTFVAVDGGVVDNEPLELARRYLFGSASKNPANRDGANTTYAVMLIDPFPNRPAWPEPSTKDALSEVVFPLVSSLVDQARFKPQELALALNESVFSRFLVAPETDDPSNPAARRLPIACGALGGFSGFLHRSFRHHDYLLGRRNAQAFLRWHLCLPKQNPVFDGFGETPDAAKWFVRDVTKLPAGVTVGADDPAELPLKLVSPVATTDGPAPKLEEAIPIVPLARRLRQPIVIGPKDRPRPRDLDVDALDRLITARLEAVVAKLVDEDLKKYVPNWIARFAIKQALPGLLAKSAREAVEAALGQISAAFPSRPARS